MLLNRLHFIERDSSPALYSVSLRVRMTIGGRPNYLASQISLPPILNESRLIVLPPEQK